MKTTKIPTKLTITIRRPNGDLEKVAHPTLKSITEAQFKQIQRDTAKAGRGNVIDYKIDYEEVKVHKNNFEAMVANTYEMSEVEKAMTVNGASK